jgi:hypothetical protein
MASRLKTSGTSRALSRFSDTESAVPASIRPTSASPVAKNSLRSQRLFFFDGSVRIAQKGSVSPNASQFLFKSPRFMAPFSG